VSAVRSETALAAPIAGGIITETLETIPNTTLRSAVVLALGLDLAPTGILLFGIQEKPTVLLLATIRRNATLLKDWLPRQISISLVWRLVSLFQFPSTKIIIRWRRTKNSPLKRIHSQSQILSPVKFLLANLTSRKPARWGRSGTLWSSCTCQKQ